MLAYSFYESDSRILQYTHALTARGDHVDVICLCRKGQARHAVIDGVHVHRIQQRTVDEQGRLTYLGRILTFMLRAAFFLTWKHLRDGYDLIHVHSVPDCLVLCAAAPKLFGTPVVLDIHDILPEFYASKFKAGERSAMVKGLLLVEKWSCAFSDHVIIANDLWKDRLVARSVPSRKCTTIRNFPDPRYFFSRRPQRTEGRFVIIYPGTLNWHQGLDIAIRAFARIAERLPHATFLIYGEGPTKNQLQELSKELGLEGRVLFKEVIPLDQIAQVMANADVAVVPKRAKSFGNEAASTKIMEFMMLGVPVVASRTKVETLYFNESMLLFFESGDEAELARCILLLHQDRELANRLVSNASSYVGENNWSVKKAEYLRLVDGLIGGRKARGTRSGEGQEAGKVESESGRVLGEDRTLAGMRPSGPSPVAGLPAPHGGSQGPPLLSRPEGTKGREEGSRPSAARSLDVIVTHGWGRVGYNIIRSLSRQGLRVGLGTDDFLGMPLYSRYRCATFRHPPFATQETEFVDRIKDVILQYRPRVYLPAGQDSLIVAKHRGSFDGLDVEIPVASYPVLRQLHRKDELARLAASVGIPTPETIFPSNEQEVLDFGNGCGNPIVLKRISSSAGRGVSLHMMDSLKAGFNHGSPLPAIKKGGEFIAQRYVAGVGYGVSMLFNHGQLRAKFTHKRLRERHRTGGVSTLRMSVTNPILEEYAEALLKHVGYHGVAMVEFRYDEEKKQGWLIEVNPRFWGSLGLAIQAGVDFPYLLYKMAAEGDVSPVLEYKTGVKVRWLFGDLLALINQSKAGGRGSGLFVHADGNDDFYWDDPLPFFAEGVLSLRKLFVSRLPHHQDVDPHIP